MSNSTVDKGKRPTTIEKPLDWHAMNLSEQVKSLRFIQDGEGNVYAMPVVLMDIMPNPLYETDRIQPVGKVKLVTPGSDNFAVVQDAQADNQVYSFGLLTQALQRVYNPALLTQERLRTPTHFKSAVVSAAGSTTVWDPAAGKKFRMMGVHISVSKDAACAGAQYLQLTDNATSIFQFALSGAALVATGQVEIYTFTFPGNGYLSIAADNNLNAILGGAFTAGNSIWNVWGTEE